MAKIDVTDARKQAPGNHESVERGQAVLARARNVPVSGGCPVPGLPTQPRPLGIDRGMIVPATFFEPLADDLLAEFEGGNEPE